MTSIKDTVRQDIERAENIQSENKYEQVLAQYISLGERGTYHTSHY